MPVPFSREHRPCLPSGTPLLPQHLHTLTLHYNLPAEVPSLDRPATPQQGVKALMRAQSTPAGLASSADTQEGSLSCPKGIPAEDSDGSHSGSTTPCHAPDTPAGGAEAGLPDTKAVFAAEGAEASTAADGAAADVPERSCR